MIEIPAGKIREYESIFDALRREVWEETGLSITEIVGEEEKVVSVNSGYEIINIHWELLSDVESMIETNPEKFYPMHINALHKYIIENHKK